MKVWRFYFIHQNEEDEDKKNYDLYAITNHRKLAKKFMKTRNMNVFRVYTSDLDEEEYTKFANENRDHVLSMERLTTKDIKDGLYTQKTVNLVITSYEQEAITELGGYYEKATGIFDSSWWAYYIRAIQVSTVLKKKLIKLLAYFEFYEYAKLYLAPEIYGDCVPNFLKKFGDDYSAPNVWVDELVLLIRLFQDTF